MTARTVPRRRDMNIREAMLASRETGRAVVRDGGTKWIRWVEPERECVYRLTADDLLAEDWTELES